MAGGVGGSVSCDKTGLFARFLASNSSSGNIALAHSGSNGPQGSTSGLIETGAGLDSDWDPYENTSIYYPFAYNPNKVQLALK